MRPALLRGLTIALLAVGTVGVLRLPATLLQAPGDSRADVIVSAAVPSHVVRMPAPAPARRAARPQVFKRLPAALPAQRPQRAAPAKPRQKTAAPIARRVGRVVRAEPSVQRTAPVPTAVPAPAAVALSVSVAAPVVAIPVVAAAPVVVAAPTVETRVDRKNRQGKEDTRKTKHSKRAKTETVTAPAAPQLLGTVAPTETASEMVPTPESRDDGDDDDTAEHSQHGNGHKRGHDKRD